MSLHDLDIANADGATVRADINSALAAIVSNFSSATAPSGSNLFALMWWYDTANNILKQRNEANTAWLTRFNDNSGIYPSFSAHRNGVNTTYGIADSTWTKLRLRSEDFDVTGDFVPDADDNGTATESRFTPSVAGTYMLTASILSASGLADTTRAIVAIYKNGVVEKSGYNRASGAQTTGVSVSALVEADGVSDYFEVFVWHGSGVSEEIDGSINATYFQGFKIAD